MRRPLALLLAISMAVLDPALRAGPHAARVYAAQSNEAEQAVAFLKQQGVIKGDDDPLKTYITDKDGTLTTIGRVIYNYARQDTKERMRDFQPTFDAMRQAGPATPKMLQAAKEAQGDLQGRFKEVFDLFEGGQGRPPAAGDAAFLQSALLSVGFDGANKARDPAKYVQLETEDAFVFMDENGVAVRMAKNWACRNTGWGPGSEPRLFNKPQFDSFKAGQIAAGTWDQWLCGEQGGVTTFSRDVQKSQQQMNRAPGKPACAPKVPETGRYNYEMLKYSDCLLEQDVDRSRRGYKIDMIVKLATMLGENVTEDQILKQTDKLFADLKAKGLKKSAGGKYDHYCEKNIDNYYQLAECKLAKRDEYVKKAEEAYKAYRQRVEGYKGRDTITQQEIQALTADEGLVKKYLTLAFLEAQRNQAYTQLEGVSWEVIKVEKDGEYVDGFGRKVQLKKGQLLARAVADSPDSKQLRDALNKGPFSPEVKRDYMKQAGVLAERVRRLLLVYNSLEAELLKTDHAGGMGVVQGALFSTQKELGEVGLDSRIYSAIPMMTHLGNEEDSGWSRKVYLWGGKLFGARGYVQKRTDLERWMPQLKAIAGHIAGGRFEQARDAVLALDPDAQKTHWQVEAGSVGDDPSRAERTEAVLRKVNQTVTGLMKTHMWVDIGRDILISSVVLAVAAPAAGAILTGVAKTAFQAANVVGQMGRIGKVAATGLRVIGAVAEHGALRLQSLSPAANTLRQKTAMGRVLTATAVRGVNAGVRHAAFVTMSGGVSGGINWAMNDFKGQAFVDGAQSGASWGAKNAWVLYVGLPSTAFEETVLARGAASLAERGLLGNVAAAGNNIANRFGAGWTTNAFDWGVGKLMSGGAAGKVLGTTVAMGDQFAKYYAFNKVVETGFHEYSWRMNSVDGADVERRIKRAQAAGMASMEATLLGIPLWAFIPTFSAKTAQAVADSQRSQQGFAEYKAAGETHRIANAAADIAELPLKNAPQRPMLTRIFEFNLMEAVGEKGNFKVTKDMKYQAIQLELEKAVGSAGGKVNPYQYYQISQQEGGMAGRLHITDEVRDQAQGMFEKAILQNPQLAQNIMKAQAGSELAGFGRVRLGHQEEVARVLYTNKNAKGVSRAHVQLAEGILEPYIATEKSVGTSARQLLESINKVKEPTPAYTKFVDGMLDRTRAWKGDPAQVKKLGYMDLVAEFRQSSTKAGLAGEEATVVGRMMDYFQAIEKRLNHFNTVGSASTRAEKALSALRLEAETGGAASKQAVVKALDGMLESVAKWRNSQPSLDAPAANGSFKAMVEAMNDSLKKMTGLSTADMGLLKTAVREVQASPALIRNPKGDGLMGWRPEQFEGMMHFMRSISLDGANSSEVIRTFLRMKTGGGKTMLAFEGLLPVAEADGAIHGGKLKSVFLTVQSNLESQARLDYRASKKVLAKLEIDTWEGFKTKIAQNKLEARGGADEYWILGDEMDGAALQPALTIGEQTAGVSRDNSGYRLLKNMGDRMKEILNRGPAELKNRVETEVRRQQSFVESMEPGEMQAKLRQTTQELLGLGNRLEQLQRRGDMAGLDRTSKRIDAVLEAQKKLLGSLDDASAQGLREAGGRISDVVRQRASIGGGDIKLARTLISDMLREQEAVLAQTAPQGKAQARSLERLAARQRAEGNLAEAAKTEAQAKRILTQSAEARAGLESNARAMRDFLKNETGAGWEVKFQKLVGERTQLVDRAVMRENPIYETFRRMREDMYGLVHSKLRTTQRWETLAETPGRTRQALNSAADALTAEAQKLSGPDKQAVLEQAAALREKAGSLSKRLEAPLNAEHSAAYQAREQAGGMLERAERTLMQLKTAAGAPGAKPEIAQQVKAAEGEVARWRTDYQKADAAINKFEGARADAARAHLTRLRLEAATALETLQPRLAQLKGPEADGVRRALQGLQTSMETGAKRLEWTPQRAVDTLQRRIAGVPTSEYLARTALRYSGAQWLMSKTPGLSDTRWARPMTPTDVGLTRLYARELIGNFLRDPFLPPQVRWKMLWSLMPSTVMPRGVTGRGSSWVLTELLNLATGYTDLAANIRMDNITGRVNVIHNGQWFDSMDTPTRRYWEIEYKSDLTLPYDHKTQVTMNDFVRDNKNVRFVGFSGTAGERFREYLTKYGVKIVGVGSEGVKNVGLQLPESPAGKFKAIGDAVREAVAHDAAQVAAGRQADALVVLSLPDTRMVKEVRRYLIKTGAIKPDQIAMVFSDAELLRLNRPEANVAQQMNLEGLNNGRVKLLMLDTRVGGRGLDLNFKGQRGGGFGGYFKFKMLLVDPQFASEAHFLQAQGRIDLGRVHSSADPSRAYHPEPATREFAMVMDVQAASKDPVFMRMLRSEPVFRQLSAHPEVVERAYQNGRFTPSWQDIQAFIDATKAQGKEGFVVQRYEETVRRYIAEKQLQVELDQLRSAGVLHEAGSFDPFHYGLSPVMPGAPYPGLGR